MALVCRSEISALTRLLRGLTITKQCCSVVPFSRQFNVAAASSCLQQKNKPAFGCYGGDLTMKVERPMQHVLLAASGENGVQPLQHRSYVKNAPVRRKRMRGLANKGPVQKKRVSFRYAGDLTTQKRLDLQSTHIDFRDLSQLENASETVQKLCSIEFASGTEKKIHRKEEMKERILQLFGEGAEREMHVAMLTVDIRNMVPHVLKVKKDKLNKSRLVEKIQLRKKLLKTLRRDDYQRFFWLLRELRIRYVLPPQYHIRRTIKYNRKQRVWEKANQLRRRRLDELKAQLEEERAQFSAHKEQVLGQLEQDAKACGMDLQDFLPRLQRQREGRTYPTILTWEERLELEDGHPLKPKNL